MWLSAFSAQCASPERSGSSSASPHIGSARPNGTCACPAPLLPLPQTLERSYLLRLHGKVVERPQHMLMRVAIGIHMEDIDEAVKTYHLLRYERLTSKYAYHKNSSAAVARAGSQQPNREAGALRLCQAG